MKFSSVIHGNEVRIPSCSNFIVVKPSQVRCTKDVPFRRSSYRQLLGRCAFSQRDYSTQVISRWRKSPEQEAYTWRCSARKASRSLALNAINEKKCSCADVSSRTATETDSKTEEYAASLRTVALCVFSAVAFGIGLGFKEGVGKASEFFAGYLLEQSLSVDNLFVFVLVFNYFKVPPNYQNRVLSYGIAGAIFFRLTLILLGTATLQRYDVIKPLLALILLYSSYKLFYEEGEDSDLSKNFIVKTCQKFIPVTSNYVGDRFLTIQDGVWKATPLLLTVAVIELSDIAFAVDSIPAVFGVTQDPFIVLTSNLFAILGLRSYYSLISESMAELEYLQPAIGVILGFIGSKMILDFFGLHIPTEVSLGMVFASLGGGVLLSLMNKSDSSQD